MGQTAADMIVFIVYGYETLKTKGKQLKRRFPSLFCYLLVSVTGYVAGTAYQRGPGTTMGTGTVGLMVAVGCGGTPHISRKSGNRNVEFAPEVE